MSHIEKIKLPSNKTVWRARWQAPDGKRRSRCFPTQGEAKAHLRSTDGIAGSATMTVLELARDHERHFDGLVKAGLREAITAAGYTSVLETHVRGDVAFAHTKLCDLTTVGTQAFLDRLLPKTGSPNTVRKVRRTLVTWCEHGQRKGWLVNNPAKPCKVEKTERSDDKDDHIVIPPKETLKAILKAAEGPREAAVVQLLMFGGFRISELLGLADENALPGKIRVRERLDTRFVRLGPTKSKKARREVPIDKVATTAVKSWRMARGAVTPFMHTNAKGETKRVPGRLFPNPRGGNVWSYQDFIRDCWRPLMERAGLLQRLRDQKKIPRPVADYSPHDMRHVAVSLWIEQGLPPKKVQELAGHSTLQLTMDLYGHLWKDEAGDEALAEASRRLLA